MSTTLPTHAHHTTHTCETPSRAGVFGATQCTIDQIENSISPGSSLQRMAVLRIYTHRHNILARTNGLSSVCASMSSLSALTSSYLSAQDSVRAHTHTLTRSHERNRLKFSRRHANNITFYYTLFDIEHTHTSSCCCGVDRPTRSAAPATYVFIYSDCVRVCILVLWLGLGKLFICQRLLLSNNKMVKIHLVSAHTHI